MVPKRANRRRTPARETVTHGSKSRGWKGSFIMKPGEKPPKGLKPRTVIKDGSRSVISTPGIGKVYQGRRKTDQKK
jgi:hypothetical protein